MSEIESENFDDRESDFDDNVHEEGDDRRSQSSLSQEEQVTHLSELVSYIAEQLVDAPDEVEVKAVEADRSMVFELLVSQDDLGKVIGRDGRTARAIRTILATAGADLDRRPILDIIE